MIHLDGWRAYLWDQACDWLERYDAAQPSAPEKPAKPVKDEVFGAYG